MSQTKKNNKLELNNQNNIHINWFPGHMNKTMKIIKNNLSLFDLIVEVVDVRAPLISRNNNIALLNKNNLPTLIILNKCDIADPSITLKWKEYFLLKKINFLIVSSKRNNQKIFLKKINDILKQKISNMKVKGLRNPQIRVLITGIPNVGKSSFINSILTFKKSKIGKLPGWTKGQQLLKMNDNCYLMDTPGILWPKIDNLEQGIKLSWIHAIDINVLPIEEICQAALKYLIINYPQYLSNFHLNLNQKNTSIEDSIQYLYLQICNLKNNSNIGIQKFLINLAEGIVPISFNKPPKIRKEN